MSANGGASTASSFRRRLLTWLAVVGLAVVGFAAVLVEGPGALPGVWPGSTPVLEREGLYKFEPDSGYHGRPDRFDTVEVRLEQRGQQLDVVVTTSRHGQTVESSRSPLPPDRAWTTTLDGQVLVGVLPATAVWVDYEENEAKEPAYGSGAGLVEPFARTVFWAFVSPPNNTEAIIDYVWSDGTRVASGRSGVLPSTTLRTQGAAGTLWIDPATNRAGYHDHTGTQLVWSQDRVRAPQPMTSMVTLANTSHSLAVGLLPEGARNVSLDLTDPDGSWRTGTIDGTTRIGYLAVASAQSGNLVHAIHYTDRQGRHSYKPSQ